MTSRLEKLQRDFFWEGGASKKRSHFIKWDVVCFDKGQGGLGVRNLSKLNKALLGK